MLNVKEVADGAKMIVNGYAFTKDNNNVKVLNLNNPRKALYLSEDGEVLETSMDDIELVIVLEYFKKNRKYLEV